MGFQRTQNKTNEINPLEESQEQYVEPSKMPEIWIG